MEAKELCGVMDHAGYTKKEKTATKLRRRRLQNRHSAKVSAARRQDESDHIARANGRLSTQMKALQARNAKLEMESAQARMAINEAYLTGEAYRREIASLSAMLLTQSVGGCGHTTCAHTEASLLHGPMHGSNVESIELQPFEYEDADLMALQLWTR
jgi:hypothetical protein